MVADDLSAPLGQNAKTKRQRLTTSGYRPPGGRRSARLFVLVFAGWALVVDDPLGGEPVAVVAIGRAPARPVEPCRPSHCLPVTCRARAATTGRTARRRRKHRLRRPRSREPIPQSAQRPSRSSTAAPASARRSRSRRRAMRVRRSISACSNARLTAPFRASRPTAPGRPTSTPAPRSRCRASRTAPRIAIVLGGLGVSANVTAAGASQSCPGR